MSMKMCITKEMAERNELPQQQQGDCKTTQSPRSGNTMKFLMSAPSRPPAAKA
jgi:hypothetical protein